MSIIAQACQNLEQLLVQNNRHMNREDMISLFASLSVIDESQLSSDLRYWLIDLAPELDDYLYFDRVRDLSREELAISMLGIAALKRLKLVDLGDARQRNLFVQLIGRHLWQVNFIAEQYVQVEQFRPLFTMLDAYHVTMKRPTLTHNITERIITLRLSYGSRISPDLEQLMRPFYMRSFEKCQLKSPLPKVYSK